jgi:hypothetical protein
VTVASAACRASLLDQPVLRRGGEQEERLSLRRGAGPVEPRRTGPWCERAVIQADRRLCGRLFMLPTAFTELALAI